ncbi:hypothetical protein SUDANB95_04245 [Actinosynnema sp. ALI-1.44]
MLAVVAAVVVLVVIEPDADPQAYEGSAGGVRGRVPERLRHGPHAPREGVGGQGHTAEVNRSIDPQRVQLAAFPRT